jgi:hypothetical protein
VKTVPVMAGRVDGVECEHCKTRRYCNTSLSLRALRNALRDQGWLCTVTDGREIDVCPQCRR